LAGATYNQGLFDKPYNYGNLNYMGKRFYFLSIFLLVGGVIMFGWGVYESFKIRSMEKSGHHASGRIVDAYESGRRKYGRTRSVDVVFKVDGQEYRRKFSVGTGFYRDHTDGGMHGRYTQIAKPNISYPEVTVMYDPGSPQKSARLKDADRMPPWVIGLCIASIGAVGFLTCKEAKEQQQITRTPRASRPNAYT